MWPVVLERFERHAPASVMARLALEHAFPAGWVDAVFEANRDKQYARELLFSTVVELMTLVSLGLRPSLHAAARGMNGLPVSLASLYSKVSRTEPAVLRALVRGSAGRLAPVLTAVGGCGTSLPGWRVRMLDGNHLPGSEKRLAPLRGCPGAALPGQSLVVYDPDLGVVVDLLACEDAHQSERAAVGPLLDSAQPGEVWVADRHFCTGTVLAGLEQAGACFIVREHSCHPRLAGQGDWQMRGRAGTGLVREQLIKAGHSTAWRRVELALDAATENGDTAIRLWSNLPSEVGAAQIADLYRTRWQVEGMFGRLEAVLNSELRSLGHPRAALLGFAVAVLACNVLAVLQRATQQAHQPAHPAADTPPASAPPSAPLAGVSCFHLAQQVRAGYEGLLIALPPERWPRWNEADPAGLAQRLLSLARAINPRAVATSKRGPKTSKPKPYVDGKVARAHAATARVLAQAKQTP